MSDENCECKNGNCECGSSCDSDGCSCESGFQRRFQTRAEQITELEAYLSELRLEVQAVEEHLADLRK